MTYPQGYMNLKLLDKIVTELPKETVVVPFFRGESLLHPQFADAMEKLSGFKEVQLATNGDALNEPLKRKAIIDASTFVSLSLHNSMVAPQESIHLGFLLAAKKRGLTTQISLVNGRFNGLNKQQFVNDWLQYVDRVRIYERHSCNGFGDTTKTVENHGEPCVKPFTETVVYWDGKVALCNHDWNNLKGMGNLNVHDSLQEVWRGWPYRITRWQHQRGNRKKVDSCRNCHYWKTSYMPKKIFGKLYQRDGGEKLWIKPNLKNK